MGESICFIMPTMDGGGAERVVSILSGEFARSGCDVTLFLTNSTHTAYALDKRVHVDTSCAESNPNFLDQIKAIRAKMRAMPNTVFISFMDTQNLFTLIAGIGMRNRIIISQRNDPHRVFGSIGWLGLLIRGYMLLRTAWYSKHRMHLSITPNMQLVSTV